MSAQKSPPWMRKVLIAAAAYNLIWGALVGLFPVVPFQLAGMKAPNYPELVQCLAMVIGLYGIAYGVAASNPYRYWAIVLVGLLGKVLGPIGLLNAAVNGRFPWRAGWMCVFNDLVWLVPFSLILAGAYGKYASSSRCLCPEVLKFALRSRTSSGATLEQLSQEKPLLVVFLRHLGCTFCRESLADIAVQRRRIEASGTRIALVHMTSEQNARNIFKKYGLADVPQISDACQSLYCAFGLKRGRLWELFGPRALLRGLGLVRRYGIGPLAGDTLQMPGVFLVYKGELIRSYRHKSIADRPPYAEIAGGDGTLELELQS